MTSRGWLTPFAEAGGAALVCELTGATDDGSACASGGTGEAAPMLEALAAALVAAAAEGTRSPRSMVPAPSPTANALPTSATTSQRRVGRDCGAAVGSAIGRAERTVGR
ncbi:MAG TPA: hypothetical protein VEQ59_10555 [Polyangiaceae bacterium]|nr:hypothetical protein [Polyangiaceae bacterium]